MAIVGSAQVRISPDGTGFSDKLRVILARQTALAKDAGKAFGDAYGKSLSRAVTDSLMGVDKDVRLIAEELADSFAKQTQRKLDKVLPDVYEKSINKAGDKAEKASESLGTKMSAAVRRGVSSGLRSGIGLEDAVNASAPAASAAAGRAGNDSGRSFLSRMLAAITSGSGGVGASIEASIGRSSARGIGNAGSQAGSAFSRELGQALGRGIVPESRAAYAAFVKLWAQGAAAGTAITGLGNALSSAVGALFALGTSAVQAGAALGGILTAGIGAAIQAGAALAVAFKGIAKAIGAGFKAADAGAQGSASATIAALRSVEDARKRLANTRIQNAERMADAENRVAKAERDLTQATNDVARAQERLTNATKAAQEELQQLNFSVEDAALAEERALLSLESAQAELEKVQFLAVDSRARREAELAFKEAELNYRQSKDRAADLAEEQARAAETGVEGTKAYIDAQNDLNSAKEREARAEEALTEAKIARERAEADSARALLDAQTALSRATQDLANSKNEAAKAADDYDKALAGLSDSAKEFVKYIVSMKDRFNEFKKVVQEPFFAAFNDSFKTLVETYLPLLETKLSVTTGILGEMAAAFAGSLTSNSEQFGRILDSNNKFLGVFNSETTTGNTVIENFAEAMLNLGEALGPLLGLFGEWVKQFSIFAQQKTDNVDGLSQTFLEWGKVLEKVGQAFGALGGLLKTLGGYAKDAGLDMLSYFTDAFNGMNESAQKNGASIKQWFDDTAKTTQAWLDFLGKVGLIFLKLGQDTGAVDENGKAIGASMAEIPKILERALPYLEQILNSFRSSGPLLATLVVNITRVIAALTDSGAFEVFFNILNTAASALATALENGVVQQILLMVAPLVGAGKALMVLSTIGTVVGKILFGAFLKIAGVVSAILTPIRFVVTWVVVFVKEAGLLRIAMNLLGIAFRFLKGPLGIAIMVITALILIFKKLYEENETFRNAVDRVVAAVKGAFQSLWNFLQPVFKWFGEMFSAVWGALKAGWDAIGKPVLGIIQGAFSVWWSFVKTFIGLVVDYFQFVWSVWQAAWNNIGKPVIDFIISYFNFWWSAIKVIFGLFRAAAEIAFKVIQWSWNTFVKPPLDSMKAAFGAFWTTVKDIFDKLKPKIENALSAVKNGWNTYVQPFIDKIKAKFDELKTKAESVFGGISSAVTGAFSGLWNGAKEGLNKLINGVNKYLIGNLNKVLVKFDVTPVPKLATFADGGYVRGPGGPTDDRIPARLSNGEYVLRAAAVKRLGKSTLDQMNQGQFPTGGVVDWAKGVIDGIKDLPGAVMDKLKEGAAAALGWLYDTAVKPQVNQYKNSDNFTLRAAAGFLGRIGEAMREWGKSTDKKNESVGGGAVVPAYKGPAGGWTYPLARRYPGKNWYGHNPANAIDIASPTGVGVISVSSGIVITALDLKDRSYGKYIRISHSGGLNSLYAHLSSFKVRAGDVVKTGQLIGYSGNTGGSRGPHLHFELNPSSSTISAMRAKGVALATGGVVRATPGGVMAMLAEGGQHERVEPLDSAGMSARDYAMIDAVAKRMGGGAGPVLVKVYLGDTELRDMVRYEVVGSNHEVVRDLRIGRRRR